MPRHKYKHFRNVIVIRYSSSSIKRLVFFIAVFKTKNKNNFCSVEGCCCVVANTHERGFVTFYIFQGEHLASYIEPVS